MSGVLSVRLVFVESRPWVNAPFRTRRTWRPLATYVGILFIQPDIDVLPYECVAGSKCAGCHRLCHACWLSCRRLARQLRGRPDRPQENRNPFRNCVGRRLHTAMFRRRMYPEFLF